MKPLYLFIAIYLGLSLSACTSVKPTTQAALTPDQLKKNPISVALYPEGEQPKVPYIIVGKERVSKYNRVGIKRQEATIRDMMRTLAASMGGDAVIDIKRDNRTITAAIISYQVPEEINPSSG